MKKIVCTHLYNDFSGSPLVLSTVIKGFLEKGYEVDVLTSTQQEGFLSNLNVRSFDNRYAFVEQKWIRVFLFFWTQFYCFLKMFQYRKQDVAVYVNTLLPFGVALAAKLMNKKVIYHIHETSVKPAFLKAFLKWVASKTASQIIYVSDYLQQQEPIENVPSTVVHNALSDDFIKTAQSYKKEKNKEAFTVLMLCSLKAYKGVDEFIKIAKLLPQLNFDLVLNAEEMAIDSYFNNQSLPENLTIFPKQSNVHPFYQKADVVVNLSHPEQWVETFGMTLLEGMEYGIPAISPPVGGCTEFVHHAYNGFQVDQREMGTLKKYLEQLASDYKLYQLFAQNARTTACNYSVARMHQSILQAVVG